MNLGDGGGKELGDDHVIFGGVFGVVFGQGDVAEEEADFGVETALGLQSEGIFRGGVGVLEGVEAEVAKMIKETGEAA